MNKIALVFLLCGFCWNHAQASNPQIRDCNLTQGTVHLVTVDSAAVQGQQLLLCAYNTGSQIDGVTLTGLPDYSTLAFSTLQSNPNGSDCASQGGETLVGQTLNGPGTVSLCVFSDGSAVTSKALQAGLSSALNAQLSAAFSTLSHR